MKRLFKNDGTLLFGYWIHTHHSEVPASYHDWGCRKVPHYDLQLERVKQGLDPIPGIKDGTQALPVMKPPVRKTFVSKTVRPMNHTPPPATLVHLHPLAQAIEEGLTRKQLCARFGISLGTLDKLIRELGLPKPVDGRKWNKPPEEARLKGAATMRDRALAKPASSPARADTPVLEIHDGRIRWTPESEELIAIWLDKDCPWDKIAKRLRFKPGGHVLCQRYHARLGFLRKKDTPPKAHVKKEWSPAPPVKKRGLFKRIWDAFFPSDCM